MSSSDSSNSPTTSASLSTPETGHEAMMRDSYVHQGYAPYQEQMMQPVDVTPKKSTPVKIISALPLSISNNSLSLSRSSSTINLRGSNIIVPSVRDKIAMLESRKQALQDLTGAAPSSPIGTPTKRTSNHNTPTKGNITSLQRQDSIASQMASPAEYLRNTPSISSFKAPLLTSYSRGI